MVNDENCNEQTHSCQKKSQSGHGYHVQIPCKKKDNEGGEGRNQPDGSPELGSMGPKHLLLRHIQEGEHKRNGYNKGNCADYGFGRRVKEIVDFSWLRKKVYFQKDGAPSDHHNIIDYQGIDKQKFGNVRLHADQIGCHGDKGQEDVQRTDIGSDTVLIGEEEKLDGDKKSVDRKHGP